MNNTQFIDPNYVPQEHIVPYDILELPSQGILYPNKKSSIKVEYLTAYDETILTSPNLSANGKFLDVLLKRKVKDLGFDPEDLLDGDRLSILLWLRTTAYGETYKQQVFDTNTLDIVEGEIDLTKLTQKKLMILPNEKNEFDFILPSSKKVVKFRFTTGKDEQEIERVDSEQMKRYNSEISERIILKLEKQIMEIDGIRDKMKISTIIRNLPIIDSRSIRKYIKDNEPGIDLNVVARTPGGGSVNTFLKFSSNFFWPEL